MGINHLNEDSISFLEDNQYLENLLSQSEEEEAAGKVKKLIKKYGNLSNIIQAEQACIKEYADLNNKSLKLLKFIKEGIRRTQRNKLSKIPILNHPNEVFKYCKLVFEENKKEVFAVLYVDYQYKLIQEEFISNGNPRSVRVDLKDIIRKALIYRAKGLIIAHNHPSGVLSASREDLRLTEELNNALKIFDISLLDHLIINDFKYYSFKANRLIDGETQTQRLSTDEKMEYIKSLVLLSRKKPVGKSNNSKEDRTQSFNQKRIEECIKIFRSIGIEACEEWVKSGAGLDSFISDNDAKYHFCREVNIGNFDIEYLKILNSQSPTFFSYIDKDGKLLFISKTYEDILNLPCKEIVGKNLKELVGEQGYTICKPFLNEALTGREVKFNYLWQYQGSEFKYLELHYIPSFDQDKKNVLGVFSFINEQKINNAAIGQYLSTIGQVLPTNSEQKILDFNDKLCRQAIYKTFKMLSPYKVQFDHRTLFDIAGNTYENSYSQGTVNSQYIENIIITGIKAGKLSCR